MNTAWMPHHSPVQREAAVPQHMVMQHMVMQRRGVVMVATAFIMLWVKHRPHPKGLHYFDCDDIVQWLHMRTMVGWQSQTEAAQA